MTPRLSGTKPWPPSGTQGTAHSPRAPSAQLRRWGHSRSGKPAQEPAPHQSPARKSRSVCFPAPRCWPFGSVHFLLAPGYHLGRRGTGCPEAGAPRGVGMSSAFSPVLRGGEQLLQSSAENNKEDPPSAARGGRWGAGGCCPVYQENLQPC